MKAYQSSFTRHSEGMWTEHRVWSLELNVDRVFSSFDTSRGFVEFSSLNRSSCLNRERYPLTSQLIQENKIPEFGIIPPSQSGEKNSRLTTPYRQSLPRL